VLPPPASYRSERLVVGAERAQHRDDQGTESSRPIEPDRSARGEGVGSHDEPISQCVEVVIGQPACSQMHLDI
jgi:hypothetical protein